MADTEDRTKGSKAEGDNCDLNEISSVSALCKMEEPRNLTWWERFVDGLEEAVPMCPVKKNEAIRGDEGWKKNDMNQLADLSSRVLNKKSEECEEVYRKRKMGESDFEENRLDESDFSVQKVIHFREFWNRKWHRLYGCFGDVTLIHAMRYTYDHAPPLARPCDALQIYSARVLGITGLLWPLHVFGMVAVRDSVDRNRNLLFYRTRDNCQILSETDLYLVLTVPTRTVVVTKNDDLMLEIYLIVKGNTVNEDKFLIYYADHLPFFSGSSYIPGSSVDYLSPFRCYSKQGILEIGLGEIRSSVEATIFVRVVDGSWPDGFHGHLGARTSSDECQEVILLDYKAGKRFVDGDGYMNLPREVVSVECKEREEQRRGRWRPGGREEKESERSEGE